MSTPMQLTHAQNENNKDSRITKYLIDHHLFNKEVSELSEK